MGMTARERYERSASLDKKVADFVSSASRAGVAVPEGLEAALNERTEHMHALYKRATRDHKSGVQTALAFEEESRRRIAQNSGYSTLLLLDMDHFKDVNDRLGHDAGDHVIRQMGRLLERNVRRDDMLCGRFGGDEYALFIENVDSDAGLVVAERVYRAFERQKERYLERVSRLQNRKMREFTASRKKHVLAKHMSRLNTVMETVSQLTLSGGATAGGEYDQLFRDADAALYEAKGRGRNRVYATFGSLYAPNWLPSGYVISHAADGDTAHVLRLGYVVRGKRTPTEAIGPFLISAATPESILQAIEAYESRPSHS